MQAEHGQHPLGCDRRQRRQLLGHQDRMAARQNRDRGPGFEPPGAGERIGHADERVDRGGVDQFGEPHRVDAGPFQVIDDVSQLVRGGFSAEPNAEADLHRGHPIPFISGVTPPRRLLCPAVRRFRVRQ